MTTTDVRGNLHGATDGQFKDKVGRRPKNSLVSERRGPSAADRRAEVLGRLVAQIAAGDAPWQKPWTTAEMSTATPHNVVSGKTYRGMNLMWLASVQPGTDGRWMTFKQARDAGYQVRKGSRGHPVFYYSRFEKPDPDHPGETVSIPILRYSTVFNADDIDGIPPLEPTEDKAEPEKDDQLEDLVAMSGASVRHVAGNRAFYLPSLDTITVPERAQFSGSAEYYSTLLHELGHWTGHESRLGHLKEHSGSFGSDGYATGELIAEMTAFMVASTTGSAYQPESSHHSDDGAAAEANSSAYLRSWLRRTKDPQKSLNQAMSQATKAAAYLVAFADPDEE